jgi:hypothetical protein
MRKGWLIAAIVGVAAGVSRGADVQIFGIHTPNPNGPSHWAVFARISNPQSSVAGQPNVAGVSSLAIDVLNNTVAGTGSATVNTALNTLPYGTTKYTDPDLFDPPNVGYGFWLFRNEAFSDTAGIHKIAAAQYATIAPGSTVPYKNFVLPGVGLTPGAVAAGSSNGDFTSGTAWDMPVQIATGTYTPSATTGAGSQVGLKMAYTPGTKIDLIRGSAATNWVIEEAVTAGIVDAKTGLSSTTTVKAGPGDANLDGVVDFNDLVALAQSYNTSGKTWFHGDFTYDGTVDFNDLVQLAQNYNQPVPGDIPSASAAFDADLARAFASVPEPGYSVLFGIGLALFTLKRRRNQKFSLEPGERSW